MWNAEMYSPIANFAEGKLNVQDSELLNGGVVYLLDFGEDRIYVGSTTNFLVRLKQHTEQLRMGEHTPFIQNAYNNSQCFNAYVLLNLPNVSDEELRNAEKSMIHLVRPKLNRNLPDKSSLMANKNWCKARSTKNKESVKTQFIALINTPDGPKTPYDVKGMCFYLHHYYQEEFMESVNKYFFEHTYHAYPKVSQEISEKAGELFILMKNKEEI